MGRAWVEACAVARLPVRVVQEHLPRCGIGVQTRMQLWTYLRCMVPWLYRRIGVATCPARLAGWSKPWTTYFEFAVCVR